MSHRKEHAENKIGVIKTMAARARLQAVSFSCLLVSDQWKNMSKALASAGHSLVAVQDNLIDVVWTDRPERSSTQLRTLAPEYTGQCAIDASHTITPRLDA